MTNVYLINGAPVDRVAASNWDEAEAAATAIGGVVLGELVDEIASRAACGLTELKFMAADAEPMSFSGYGAVFNNVDFGGDMITPGAFTKSLDGYKASGRLPAMFYEHGKSGGGPAMPVGVWTGMSEDQHGLKVSGKLFDHSLGRDLYVAMKGGGIGGLSIGYKVMEHAPRVKPTDPKRTLKSLHLGEVSLVNDPMNPMARFTAVKSAGEIKTIRDFETFLRDAGGFSGAHAKAIASRGFKAFDAGRDDGEGLIELADALRRNARILQS
jgi:HK97 family phage prohead protease